MSPFATVMLMLSLSVICSVVKCEVELRRLRKEDARQRYLANHSECYSCLRVGRSCRDLVGPVVICRLCEEDISDEIARAVAYIPDRVPE